MGPLRGGQPGGPASRRDETKTASRRLGLKPPDEAGG